jgi:hypothetical protein
MVFLVLHYNSCFSQSSFSLVIGSEEYIEIPKAMEEDEDGNLYLAGMKQIKGNPTKCGFLFKINQYGEVIQEYDICESGSSVDVGHIIRFSDSIYVFGDKHSLEGESHPLLFNLLFDAEFNIIKSTENSASIEMLNLYPQSVIFNNGCFTVLLNGKPLEDSVYYDVGFLTLDKNLDSINCVIDRKEGSQLAYDFIEHPDGSGFKVFAQGYYPDSYPGYSELVRYDSSFNYIEVDSVPYHIYNQFSCRHFNESSYLLSGKKGLTNPIKWDVGILKLSYEDQTLFSNHLGSIGDTDTYAGVFHNIDFISNNSIYLGGTSNFIPIEYPWQTTNSWIMLYNLDSNLNLNWQKFYGGDAFYHLRGLKTTQDGGCLMYATRYDESTQFEEFDVFILKVDSTGLLTSTGEGPHLPVQQLAIVPNPARDIVSIRYPDIFGYDDKEIEVYNSQGFPVISVSATQDVTETRVDVSALPSGLYFVVLKVEGKKVGTGKMVKW